MFAIEDLLFYITYGLVAFGAYLVVKHLAEGKKDN
jgi:hypothetical protein